MKPIKILFLLCYIATTPIILSCSAETEDPDVSTDIFEAYINDTHFTAKDVVLMLRGDYIDIIGNDTETDQSIFITLKRANKERYVFGKSSINGEGNEAAFYNRNNSDEFTTSFVNKNCGEVKLDISKWSEGMISGEFYFEASNDENKVIQVSQGRFEKNFYE
ncbi:hypothetical protein SAMN04487906_2940 [Zhouia amylolytica]|uniref:Lipoprotein n=2 Tax=Zhouia amylolytica TaxID=376730 RepID=W2USU8_9FLAO|nr:DUF6252 family protein [Zhouia amylolytica]ETN96556.1 hypothetical protein P278_06340 [Zhouia amylolytica AD3]MCQ0109958.1 hypothetical protein [Zhouia amylolytica]SFT09876.1 hypothetical protein SAMN04487906_2940 [Zhouia amylolytica]